MTIELRSNYAYALLTPTSMGVRLTPADGQPMYCGANLLMHASSAESNVLSVSSYLGLPAKVLTTFVKGSPIARFIKDSLASRHIAFEGPEVEQGGPWGYRHQFNLADSGCGTRGPRVHNDRAGEVGRTLNVKDFDLDRIFAHEGVQIMHLSGLIAALSPETSSFCLELARAAKRHGTRISFDLNHRATFWKGREKELHEIFTEIARAADILVGNEEDFQLCLHVEGPEAGGVDLAAKIDNFKAMINRAKQAFPNAKVFATTLREVISVNCHRWGAIRPSLPTGSPSLRPQPRTRRSGSESVPNNCSILAQQRQMDDALGQRGGPQRQLLDDVDPFVQGIAEWALATKVNLENNGQEILWPRSDPPQWYERWTALDDDFLLNADYVRQGAPWGIHHQPASMLGSVDLILKRAAGVLDEIARSDDDEARRQAAQRHFEELQELRQQLARRIDESPEDLTALRRLWLQARRTARWIVLAHPSIDFDRLVYIKRHVALFANITGSQYPWSHKPGEAFWSNRASVPAARNTRSSTGNSAPDTSTASTSLGTPTGSSSATHANRTGRPPGTRSAAISSSCCAVISRPRICTRSVWMAAD
jgi:2-dehydro-3-deoxygluconokinase